jgi:hypothetical protein
MWCEKTAIVRIYAIGESGDGYTDRDFMDRFHPMAAYWRSSVLSQYSHLFLFVAVYRHRVRPRTS